MTSNTWLNWDVQVISEDVSAEATHGTFCIVKDEDEIFVPEVTEHYLEESHSEDTMQNGEWKLVQMSQVTKQPTSTSSTERVKCPECSKTLTSSAYLREHMRIHTGEKPYACHECGQAFAQKCNLRMHKRVHTGERPFICGICGRAFSRASHLKGHMLQHTGDKPYSCDQCGQQFTNSQGRKNHMKLHLGERPFQCEICNVTFVHKPSLKAHIKTHRREARYYCSICKRKFIFRSALYEHMTFHSKNKLYECDQCNKRFKHKNYLKKHKSSICASRSLLRDGGLESGGTQEPVHLKYRVLSANERALPDYIETDEEETGDVVFSQGEGNEEYLDAAFTKLLRRSGYQP